MQQLILLMIYEYIPKLIKIIYIFLFNKNNIPKKYLLWIALCLLAFYIHSHFNIYIYISDWYTSLTVLNHQLSS